MDIINDIRQAEELTYDRSFAWALQCGKLLTGSDSDRIVVRCAAIHILDKWRYVPEETKPIWADIIEAIGFYPYISKNAESIHLDTLADEIRQKSFLSDFLPNTYMHSKQKELSDYLRSDKNVVASAPTSFGKSLLIEELVASQEYRNIVIIQPTLALLDETRVKLKKYKTHYKIVVRTSQDHTPEKGDLFLLTAERVMEYVDFPKIDLLIIDEFYKMSLRCTDNRADILNNAFLKIYDTFNPKFYLLGPNIDGITEGFEERYNAIFFKSDYSLVDCNVIDLSNDYPQNQTQRTIDKQKMSNLCKLLDELNDSQTLVYCATPARARRFAKEYYEHLVSSNILPKTNLPIIEWIEKNISRHWCLAKELKYGIAIHDGSLQKHIGASIIQYFNQRHLRCVFCTSTIIEGVNTSAKNIVLFDGKKGGKEIDFFDYSNIKGRSGRLMEHYVGNIYNFAPIPSEDSIVIDIPFVEQDKELLPNEILINIRQKDVQTQVVDRYNKLYEIQNELMDIIKRNGTNVNGQMNIYYALERDISTSQYANIAWAQMPNWDKLIYVLELAENNAFNFEGRHGVVSVRQLARYIDMYRKNKNILHIVGNIYHSKVKAVKSATQEQKIKYLDDAIETGFHIYRHWFQFTVPKAFRVVDSLQRYVCENHGKRAGSYSYFVQQLENDFIREELSILVEYGIPSDTVRNLMEQIPETLSEDDVIQYIQANKERLFAPLMQYERDRLEHCL
ncbi:MAG: DEAD/DEAH box helicase [Oscillospiraceae bacterium]|nr:DEAD/DEAH box helicase [Oscillospiraceae bacterium]